MDRQALLTRTFVELADSLVDDFDLMDLMVLLAERSVELTDGSAAGLVLLDGQGALRLMAATSEALETVELFQLQSDEGPCLDCSRTGLPVIADDLADHADRWPAFVPVALGAGYHSVHTFPLRLRNSTLGALGVFRTPASGLGPEDVGITQALADVATIAVLQSRAVSNAQAVTNQLQHALESRVVIEQAKGFVAEQADLNTDQAFIRLRAYARSHQRRLTDVARDIVERTIRVESLTP